MSLISLVIVLIVIGILLWIVNTQITIIDPTIKKIINIVVIIAICIWLLSLVGLIPDLNAIRVGN
jgi:hypothetical protein